MCLKWYHAKFEAVDGTKFDSCGCELCQCTVLFKKYKNMNCVGNAVCKFVYSFKAAIVGLCFFKIAQLLSFLHYIRMTYCGIQKRIYSLLDSLLAQMIVTNPCVEKCDSLS